MIYAWEQYAKYALCLMGGAMGYLVSHHLYQSTAFHQEAPIRWSWLPFLGWAIEFGKRPLSFLLECREQYDDIFGLVIGGNRMFFITEPFSTNVIIRPCKDLHWEEFHHEILQNFFNVKSQTLKSKCVDEDLMRKYYSTYLLR